MVDCTEHCDQPAVLAGMADEQLTPLGTLGARGSRLRRDCPQIVPGGLLRGCCVAAEPHHDAAFAAACATVSRSAKPSIRTTSLPGGRRTSTAGSWIAPYLALSESTPFFRTSIATNELPASCAPAWASSIAVPSIFAFGS